MATFKAKNFSKCDSYMTPKSAWENVKHLIPTNKIIWESAYGDGSSGKHLQELLPNNTIIHRNIDYFIEEPTEWDLQITNIPFSKKKEWITRGVELNKPFMIIMPCSALTTLWFRSIILSLENQNDLQIIIPRKRIHFVKKTNGIIPSNWRSSCNFDCFYYCYKFNLDKSMNWLI